MLKTFTIFCCLTASVALAGCGSPRGNAMATDGAVGAGGGALLGAVAGFNPLVGAAVGGAGGAAVGAATH
jgi:osmotically inducible lipoprotein OsmB